MSVSRKKSHPLKFKEGVKKSLWTLLEPLSYSMLIIKGHSSDDKITLPVVLGIILPLKMRQHVRPGSARDGAGPARDQELRP